MFFNSSTPANIQKIEKMKTFSKYEGILCEIQGNSENLMG